MAPIRPSKIPERVVVHERRDVAELLAGGALQGAAGDLVDPELRAVARAVLELRTWRQAPDDRVMAAACLLGGSVSSEELERLRREGGLLRRAA